MKDDIRTVTAQGHEIPALGFGTWQLTGERCVKDVADALDRGYRHIDTAAHYDNEKEVGRGIRASGVDPDDVFITTKVWWTHLTHQEAKDAAEDSLGRLGVDHIDLLLVHWPDTDRPMTGAFAAMQELREKEKVLHMGVSNFTPELVDWAVEQAPILCNQVEYHPFLAQDELLEKAREHDLILTAYSPLGRGRVMEDETLQEIGGRHDKTPAQVALRWLLQQDRVAAIPRADDPDHRQANLEIFDFRLDDEEMERISALDEGLRLVDPEFAPDWKE